MSTAQIRVFMLLVIVALLEVAAHPAVKSYFKGVYTSVGKGVST
jgi:hypothetical protein